MLRCPNCHFRLEKQEKIFCCENGHSFDIAKQGYVNLVLNHDKQSGDNELLVQARHEFLKQGYYEFLKTTLIEIMEYFPNETILDAGCGEGYYTNTFATCFSNVIGIDLSKKAIQIASKEKQAQYCISSIQNIALMDQSVDVIVNIFSVKNEKEFHRVLKDDGYLIEVVPNENHLVELKQVLYDDVRLNELNHHSSEYFELVDKIEIQDKKIVNQNHLQSLFQMTPYYYKTSIEDKNKMQAIHSLEITFGFVINIYARR